MSGLWNWLAGAQPNEKLLEGYWNNFISSYHKSLEKNPELSYIENAGFCTYLEKFCILLCNLLVETLSKEQAKIGIGPCFNQAFEKDYFSTLIGYGKAVMIL